MVCAELFFKSPHHKLKLPGSNYHRFPTSLRACVQNVLAETWNMKLPFQSTSPASLAASLLIRELGAFLPSYRFIDFCSGSGGPTPFIERAVNNHLAANKLPPVDFVLTDLYPHIDAWHEITHHNPHITYESRSVDASQAPIELLRRGSGKQVMRLFSLAFHHFDDELARKILRDTVETSEGFAIFELQDRSFSSFVADSLLPLGVVLAAPFYAQKWKSLALFVFTWLIPILPLVLFWDGYVSSLRTRDPDEVEVLLRTCGADTSEWVMVSGSEVFLWPFGQLNWIICKPMERA